MELLTPIEVYKSIRDNYKSILLQENPEMSDDQLNRKSNIYAVKYTWFYYNVQHKIKNIPSNLKLKYTTFKSEIGKPKNV